MVILRRLLFRRPWSFASPSDGWKW